MKTPFCKSRSFLKVSPPVLRVTDNNACGLCSSKQTRARRRHRSRSRD